jgi:hypothetical protein
MNQHEVFMDLVRVGAFTIDHEGCIWRNGSGKRAEKESRYPQVMFRESKGVPWRYVYAHRVVAIKFHGDIPEDHEVNHKDGEMHNNHPDNLEIVTKSKNGLHCVQVLGKNRGSEHGAAILTEEDVIEIRRL